MKTYSAKPGEITRKWFVVDATDKVLGRLATRVATVLRGKHKPVYTPHADTGDFVIVINAEKVKLTGAKLDDKIYRTHSLYPGGLREMPYRKLLATHPERAIERAVKGMLPKGTLGRSQLRKLKVYAGEAHPHVSQKPEVLDLEGPIPVYAEPVPPRTKKVVDQPEQQDTAKTEDEPKPKAKSKAKAKPKSKAKPKAKAKAKAKPKTAKPKAAKPKVESDDEPKTGSVDADEAPDETKES